jgi:SPP1 gp7 family putative phage head morphogenesis protein
MADKAHILTDKKLEEMEKHLSAIYSTAQKDIQKKADEYFEKFKAKDDEYFKKYKSRKMTKEEYKKWQHWRRRSMMTGKRFTAMKEDIAKQLLNVNQTATAYINDELPEVYALNYNALADTVDGVGGYSFTLVDRDTIKNLATTDKSLLPFRELDPAKDIPWNMKKINGQVLQGIIQGESIPNISKRIMNVQNMNRDAAIRSARTIVTGAENKGRLDSFKRAEQDGIILEKEWIATSDSRTRDWHNELDGQTRPVDKPFENAIGKIMYPGDPSADGANVYNCRCSMASVVKGFKKVK